MCVCWGQPGVVKYVGVPHNKFVYARLCINILYKESPSIADAAFSYSTCPSRAGGEVSP